MAIVKLLRTVVACPRSRTGEVLENLYRFGEFHVESKEDDKRLEIINELYLRARNLANDLESVVRDLNISVSQGVIDILIKGEKIERQLLTVSGIAELITSLEEEAKKIVETVRTAQQELIEIEKRLQNAERDASTLRMITHLGVDYQVLKKFRHFSVGIYSAQLRDIVEVRKTLSRAFMTHVPIDRNLATLIIITKSGEDEKVDRIAKSLNLKRIEAPEELSCSSFEALEILEKRIAELKERREYLTKLLRGMALNEGQRIYAMREAAFMLRDTLDRLRGRFKRTSLIVGYIPSTKREELSARIGRMAYVEFSDVEPSHHTHGHQEEPPTLISHNWYFDAYRPVTEMQGTPGYFEVDPTPYVSIFFAIFYGIMSADLGQGLILAALGLAIYLRARGNLRSWGKLLMFLGVSSAIVGFMIQEAFGFKLTPVTGTKPIIELLEHHGETATLSRDGVLKLFMIAPLLGFIHVSTGIILGSIKLLKMKEYAEAIFSKWASLAMYVFGLLFVLGFLGAGSFQALFTSASPAPLIGLPSSQVGTIGLYGVLACIFVLLLGKLVAGFVGLGPRLSIISAVGGGLLEVLENIIHFMSNSLSYLRISILLIIHVALMILINAAWHGLGPASLPILIIGNIGVMGLEGTLAFIQTLRLHLYEFFTKFYEGVGKPFTPLRISSRMVEVLFKD
ncbi:MAG: V-type ATPase 116kDa subunit family protein [Nitrososphaerota archaeon]